MDQFSIETSDLVTHFFSHGPELIFRYFMGDIPHHDHFALHKRAFCKHAHAMNSRGTYFNVIHLGAASQI